MSGTDGLQGPILITGGRGRLGRALGEAGGEGVVALSRPELDIGDASAVARVLAERRPRAVINAAVVSSVEAARADPDGARRVNAEAPAILARACAEAATPLVHLSTDYVFGAPTDRPWREDDPVSPVNLYGEMKAEGEVAALSAGGRVCVARVAWLFGDGEDFPSRMLTIGRREGTVMVAEDQIGSPSPLAPLAARLLRLAAMLVEGRAVPPILHLAGSPPISRADWVAAAFSAFADLGGRPPSLVRARRDAFSDQDARPAFSALDAKLAAAMFGSPLDWTAAMPGLAVLWLAREAQSVFSQAPAEPTSSK